MVSTIKFVNDNNKYLLFTLSATYPVMYSNNIDKILLKSMIAEKCMEINAQNKLTLQLQIPYNLENIAMN